MRLPLLFALLAAPWAHAQAVLLDRIVAVVHDKAITRSAVDERVRLGSRSREEALEALIEEHLIERECDQLSIAVEPDEVERALAQVKETNKLDDAQFEAALRQQGFTLAVYKQLLRRQLLDMRFVMRRRDLTATLPADEEARAQFMANERKRLLTELRAKTAVEVRP